MFSPSNLLFVSLPRCCFQSHLLGKKIKSQKEAAVCTVLPSSVAKMLVDALISPTTSCPPLHTFYIKVVKMANKPGSNLGSISIESPKKLCDTDVFDTLTIPGLQREQQCEKNKLHLVGFHLRKCATNEQNLKSHWCSTNLITCHLIALRYSVFAYETLRLHNYSLGCSEKSPPYTNYCRCDKGKLVWLQSTLCYFNCAGFHPSMCPTDSTVLNFG